MKSWKTTLLLVVIIAIAFVLRGYRVSTNPPSISWDEASIGYNAYSILKTGKDEHGKFMPIDTFAAFGDYKPPVPIYLTVPFVALFGVSELAVRAPSVVAGTLSIWIIYLLVCELFVKSKQKTLLAFITAGLLAISPWHIMLSRAGFEANIALLWILLGAWLIRKAVTNPTLLYICWLPFVAGIYTFNSARYAGPLIAFGVAVSVYKQLLVHKRQLLLGMLISLVLLFPIVPHLLSKESRLRFNEVSIFTDLRTVLTANARQTQDGSGKLSVITHNRRIGYAREYFIHFFDHFEPRFLFVHGDGNPKFSIQDTGQLLVIGAPFLIYGMFAIFAESPAIGWLLIWWLVVSIAPAAVARETPHALRTENALPVWLIFTSYGIVSWIRNQVAKNIKLYLFIGICFLFIFNFYYFWHTLMAHYPKEYSGEWQYGYKNAILLAQKLEKEYDTIVLTESIGRPYIYALFYGNIDPVQFWKTKDASFDAAGFYNVYGFNSYRFTRQGVAEYKGKVLYILAPKDVPENAHVVETIRLLNGNPVLVAFD
jgi:4-amino-4-deoxy-L-arabinose transferase-like glycosyltransferase